jgi:[ribosomal protein S18]-alanine N-acetyltransferase
MKGPAPVACRLRVAQPGDAEPVADLHSALFDSPWTGDSLRRLMELPSVRGLVAETGTAHVLAGFILGLVAADEAEVLSIGVAPAWQRRGIAGLLMREFTASVSRSGAKCVFLEVAADNAPALALYSREGFRCVGLRKRYYERRGVAFADALALTLAW